MGIEDEDETARDIRHHDLAAGVSDTVVHYLRWGLIQWGPFKALQSVVIKFDHDPHMSGLYHRIAGAKLERDLPAVGDLSALTIHLGVRAEGESRIAGGHASGRVYLKCLASEDSSPAPALSRPRVRHALIHELIHFAEWRDGISDEATAGYSQDKESYYNKPFEMRAYFHAVAEPLFALDSAARKNPDEAVARAEELGLLDPDSALRALSDSSFAGIRDFLKSLTPDNRDALDARTLALHATMLRSMGLDAETVASPGMAR